jgi:arginyl-tRNA synthetase
MAETQVHDVDQLAGQVEGLSLDSVANAFPDCFPRDNLLDLWRAHISNVLGDISGVSKDIIYRAIAWTSGLDKGDFMIPVPALRVKGAKPDVLANEWISKVAGKSHQVNTQSWHLG